MFKKKSVLFHTDASLEQAQHLLEGQVVKGSTLPNHPVDTLKDTLRTDDRPFRGEVAPGQFKLTRRKRGKNAVRIKLEGTLTEKKSGGTEIRATMSPPATLTLGLFGGLLALLIVGGGSYAGGLPGWVPLLMALAGIPAVALNAFLYDKETSATFSALRDAIPERVPQGLAEVTSADQTTSNLEPRTSNLSHDDLVTVTPARPGIVRP